MQRIRGVDGGGAQHSLGAQAGVFAQPAAVGGVGVRAVAAGDAHFQCEPFVQRIHGPVAAERHAGAVCGQQACGLDHGHALGAEDVHEAERVSCGFAPLHRQHRNHIQRAVAGPVLLGDDLVVGDSRADVLAG